MAEERIPRTASAHAAVVAGDARRRLLDVAGRHDRRRHVGLVADADESRELRLADRRTQVGLAVRADIELPVGDGRRDVRHVRILRAEELRRVEDFVRNADVVKRRARPSRAEASAHLEAMRDRRHDGRERRVAVGPKQFAVEVELPLLLVGRVPRLVRESDVMPDVGERRRFLVRQRLYLLVAAVSACRIVVPVIVSCRIVMPERHHPAVVTIQRVAAAGRVLVERAEEVVPTGSSRQVEELHVHLDRIVVHARQIVGAEVLTAEHRFIALAAEPGDGTAVARALERHRRVWIRRQLPANLEIVGRDRGVDPIQMERVRPVHRVHLPERIPGVSGDIVLDRPQRDRARRSRKRTDCTDCRHPCFHNFLLLRRLRQLQTPTFW